ncbi:MAG: 4Fe-4S binding protein [Oscillospiraceae bacterium]|jgi:2-oxoglutarate ferredoxin oxidoreductase subunit delta|nr:4Fe-4S binding protein [Oscillospiraceae bacterium]
MPKITIDENLCKGCELCVVACPKHIIALDNNRLNAKGYHPAGVTAPDDCIGCAFCATMCPDCAITVEK